MTNQKKSQEKKLHIIQCGARLIIDKGYTGTGLKEILDAANIPKGSFYHYFSSKKDFGLQVIDYFMTYISAYASEKLSDYSIPPLQRLREFFDEYLEAFEKSECRYGCPIGKLTLELAGSNKEFRVKLNRSLQKVKDMIADCLKEVYEQQDASEKANVTELAEFILNSWEGAVLAMKADKSVEPLRVFDKMIFDFLLIM